MFLADINKPCSAIDEAKSIFSSALRYSAKRRLLEYEATDMS